VLFRSGAFDNNKHSKIFDAQDFGYTTITIERPLRDSSGGVVISSKGKTKGKIC
jgi:type I restriction enzyme M protein